MPTKQTSKSVKWLHISDLHLGCPGRSFVPQVLEEFKKSLKEQVNRIGAPDIVIITGDLSH